MKYIDEISNFDVNAMKMALNQARKALLSNEIPIGAVIVCKGQIIAQTYNLTETLCDTSAHAEMQAITAAANALGAKYLKNCTIYVTLEPCPMCAAALKWAQIDKIFWAADDPKFGFTTLSELLIHPKTLVNKGLCKEESEVLLNEFFAKLRQK